MNVILLLVLIMALPFLFLKALGFGWRLLLFAIAFIMFCILFWFYEQNHVMELAQLGGGVF